MDFFGNILSLIGGLALFLFGMNNMGQGLEKRAGKRLKGLLERLTSSRFRGLLLGIAVTALIQSSSAVTVMAVGFVNSGLMSLSQVIGIVMGANIGTTVTSWLLSLTQLEGDCFLLRLFKPASFTPILALIGIVFYMFSKKDSRRSTGGILLGFAVLMFGMDAMSAAVKPLSSVPAFGQALLWFQNPILGVLAGAVLTAIIQSSSASVGILQALAGAGQLTVGAAIPIIMGQNIGTCVTTLISAVGANRNAKRAAMIHLYFNIIGTVVILSAYTGLDALLNFAFAADNITAVEIAVIHTLFNLLCTVLLFPFANLLERLAVRTVPDREEESGGETVLDERLLTSPALAVARSRAVAEEMAELAVANVRDAFSLLENYNEKKRLALAENEVHIDRIEDEIGNYLVSIGSRNMSESDSVEITALLHLIGDIERISDHALNLAEAAEQLANTASPLSEAEKKDLRVLISALDEILSLSIEAFCRHEREAALRVEPLEQVIDGLKAEIGARNIERLRTNESGVEASFLFADMLGDLERIADHCSNIAGVLLSMSEREMRVHDYLNRVRRDENSAFDSLYQRYRARFRLE